MKKIFFLLAFTTTSIISLAQNGGYAKGDKLLNIGIGVNSYYDKGIPIGASFETGVSDAISVGANVDHLSNKYNYGSGLSYKFTALYIGVRGSYHVNELLKITNEKIDLYGGAVVGYRSFKWKDSGFGESLGNNYGSGVYVGAFIGGKYYFTNSIGVFTELGAIGSTNARIGLGFKF